MLIGVTGAKGSGKDTFAEPFIQAGFKRTKVAGGLKEMLSSLYRYAGYDQDMIDRKLEGSLKEKKCNLLGCTPRLAMQTLGTEWRLRDLRNPSLWTDVWAGKTAELLSEGYPVICTDIRFDVELDRLRELGGTLIRVDRPGISSEDSHTSETEMLGLPVDLEVKNHGTISELHEQAEKLIKELIQ